MKKIIKYLLILLLTVGCTKKDTVKDKINTIIEEMQNEDIIAYITEEYIQQELECGKLRKLELGIESPALEYGIYYNSNNKIPEISYFYPNLFDSEEIEEKKQERKDELSVLRFKHFADSYNKKYKEANNKHE